MDSSFPFRELERHQIAAIKNCAQPCQANLKAGRMDNEHLFERLAEIAQSGAFTIYVIEQISGAASPQIIAIFLQDMAERKWQVIRLIHS